MRLSVVCDGRLILSGQSMRTTNMVHLLVWQKLVVQQLRNIASTGLADYDCGPKDLNARLLAEVGRSLDVAAAATAAWTGGPAALHDELWRRRAAAQLLEESTQSWVAACGQVCDAEAELRKRFTAAWGAYVRECVSEDLVACLLAVGGPPPVAVEPRGEDEGSVGLAELPPPQSPDRAQAVDATICAWRSLLAPQHVAAASQAGPVAMGQGSVPAIDASTCDGFSWVVDTEEVLERRRAATQQAQQEEVMLARIADLERELKLRDESVRTWQEQVRVLTGRLESEPRQRYEDGQREGAAEAARRATDLQMELLSKDECVKELQEELRKAHLSAELENSIKDDNLATLKMELSIRKEELLENVSSQHDASRRIYLLEKDLQASTRTIEALNSELSELRDERKTLKERMTVLEAEFRHYLQSSELTAVLEQEKVEANRQIESLNDQNCKLREELQDAVQQKAESALRHQASSERAAELEQEYLDCRQERALLEDLCSKLKAECNSLGEHVEAMEERHRSAVGALTGELEQARAQAVAVEDSRKIEISQARVSASSLRVAYWNTVHVTDP